MRTRCEWCECSILDHARISKELGLTVGWRNGETTTGRPAHIGVIRQRGKVVWSSGPIWAGFGTTNDAVGHAINERNTRTFQKWLTEPHDDSTCRAVVTKGPNA
jgi:hypothetical protein